MVTQGGNLCDSVRVFIGSSIFLAFFMATDPATTPLTIQGQIIFGVGLAIINRAYEYLHAVLRCLFVALVIMNLTVPALDRVGQAKANNRMLKSLNCLKPKHSPLIKSKNTNV